MKKSNISTKQIVTTGMFCAIAFVAVLLGKLVPNVAGFLSYDPKDAVVAIAGFVMGPVTALIVSAIVSLIEMLSISTTGPYGLIMNVVSTVAFAVPAALIYKRSHSYRGAVLGLAVGIVTTTVCMLLWNYIITPFYMGVPRSVVAGMLVPVFLPFNLIKGLINAGLTLLIYKPVVNALRQAKLLPPSTGTGARKTGLTWLAVGIVVTGVLLLLVLLGIL